MWKIKKLEIHEISILLLSIYITSLFIFVHDEQLVIISQFLFLIFAMTALIEMLTERKVKFHDFYIVFFIIMILSLTSYYWALEPNVTRIFSLIQLFFLMFLVFNIVKTGKDINLCLKSILVGGLIMGGYSIYFYGVNSIIHSLISENRLGGEINQINTFGYLSSITFIIAIYYSLFKKKYYLLLFSIIPFVFVLATGSKRSLLLLVIGLLLILIFKYIISNNKLLGLLFLITIISLVFPLLWYLTKDFEVFNRLTSLSNLFTSEGEVDESTLVRGRLISFGFEQFLNKPFLGYGTQQYNVLYNQAFGIYLSPHNGYIRMLVEYGVVGFILYYGVFVYLIIKLLATAFKKNNHISMILAIIIIFILISDIATESIYDKFTYILLGISFVQINSKGEFV